MRISFIVLLFFLLASGSLFAQKHQTFYFNSGSATLSDTSQARFDAWLKTLTNTSSKEVYLEGHTDSTAGNAFNLHLSVMRAEAIRKLLLNAGFPSRSISTNGYGSLYPEGNNTTAEGRATNRRVEVFISSSPAMPDKREFIPVYIRTENQKEHKTLGSSLIIEDSTGKIIYAGRTSNAEPYHRVWLHPHSTYKTIIIGANQVPQSRSLNMLPYFKLSPNKDSITIDYFTTNIKVDAGNASRIFPLDKNKALQPNVVSAVKSFTKDSRYDYVFRYVQINPLNAGYLPLSSQYILAAGKVKTWAEQNTTASGEYSLLYSRDNLLAGDGLQYYALH